MKKLFLCTCNKTLNKWIDFARIEKEMGNTFDAVHIHDALCLKEGVASINSEISEEDSVVVGACTSQIIGASMAKQLKSELISYVPLREQVAWVHKDDHKGASNKAIVLLCDAAIQLDYMDLQTTVDTQIEKKVLIIGGCIA
ncbi:MAG: hypothetical protein KAU48_06790, partial [Candidatus Thorarchaeota archaeon]|nr:hypothetical protein [Candidatus Thorarchaeota archaeon]